MAVTLWDSTTPGIKIRVGSRYPRYTARKLHVGSPLFCQMDVVLLQDRRPGDASVENIGIQVRPIRPGYGAQFRIDAQVGGTVRVPQRLEDPSEAEATREIDHATHAVLEPKMQAIIGERFCGNNVHQHDLLQRRNRLELCLAPRPVAIL